MNISSTICLQDESFPTDELFDELNISNMRKHCQHRNELNQQSTNFAISTTAKVHNLSADSSLSSCEQPALNLSGKTCASDPVGLDAENKANIERNATTDSNMSNSQHTKAFSYQDIHSEYTKRRFKHVASKVGQYIAQIRAQDQKRRNSGNFQRHHSLPETLTPKVLTDNCGSSARYSADELHKLNDSSNSNGDAGTSDRNDHESSNEIDAVAYERLLNENERIQSYNDYLQAKLDEKMRELNILKRNLDFLRFEMTNHKDKQKRQTMFAQSALSSSVGTLQLNSQFYCPSYLSKATQTEFVTPLTQTVEQSRSIDISEASDLSNAVNGNVLGSNGNTTVVCADVKTKKTNSIIQALLLNFGNDSTQVELDPNSNVELHQRSTTTNHLQTNSINCGTTNNSRSSHPSSNDSAIEIEAIELRSPLPAQHVQGQVHNASEKQSSEATQAERFYYYDKRCKRYVALEVINLATFNNSNGQSDRSNESTNVILKKKQSLGTRMLRLFGPCARCDDPNQTLDISNNTYAQVPLLEKSFDHCRNHR